MYSDLALLDKIQAERNPTMGELEREHAVDLHRHWVEKSRRAISLGFLTMEQEEERWVQQIKRGRL